MVSSVWFSIALTQQQHSDMPGGSLKRNYLFLLFYFVLFEMPSSSAARKRRFFKKKAVLNLFSPIPHFLVGQLSISHHSIGL